MSATLSGGAAPTAARRLATSPRCAASTAPQARSSALHVARAASRAAASAAAAATAARCLVVACALRSACSLSGRGDGLRDARWCVSLLISGPLSDAGCGCATPGSGAAGRAAVAGGVLLLASPARLPARGPLRCHCCGHLAADTPSAAGGGLGSLQWASLRCADAAAGVPLRWRYSSSPRCAFARSSTTSRSCAVANLASRAAASAWRALGTHRWSVVSQKRAASSRSSAGKPFTHLLARALPSHAPRKVVQATSTAVAARRCCGRNRTTAQDAQAMSRATRAGDAPGMNRSRGGGRLFTSVFDSIATVSLLAASRRRSHSPNSHPHFSHVASRERLHGPGAAVLQRRRRCVCQTHVAELSERWRRRGPRPGWLLQLERRARGPVGRRQRGVLSGAGRCVATD